MEWYKISYIARDTKSGTIVNESKMTHMPNRELARDLLSILVKKRRLNDRLHSIEREYTMCVEHKPGWNQEPGRTKRVPDTGNCASIW